MAQAQQKAQQPAANATFSVQREAHAARPSSPEAVPVPLLEEIDADLIENNGDDDDGDHVAAEDGTAEAAAAATQPGAAAATQPEPSIPVSDVMRLLSFLAAQAQPPPAPAITTSFSKEADRIAIPAWPDAPGMLEQWLFALQANVVSASSLPDIATTFFSEVRDSRISDMQLVSLRDPRLAGLDTKL